MQTAAEKRNKGMLSMSKRNSKEESNYLDFIPIPAKGLKYDVIDGKVTIYRENVGVFNRIAQIALKKPKVSQIHLDEIGNFIWPHLNGENSIMDITALLKEEFGENAEPLYDRAVRYFNMLAGYGFIEYTN